MLVECVPNFSEGRRPEVLRQIVGAAEGEGVELLGFSYDEDHHRAVLTLAGDGEAVAEAVFRAVRVAVRLIDLRHHQGTHPRIGAADVIPFVPLGDTPLTYCVDLARRLGRRMAEELAVPVYLYEAAATRPSRRNLANIRRGQFEGLAERMQTPHGRPDFGGPTPHPTAGASAVGARPALIAFNVYLGTADVAVAQAVAATVRGSSGGLIGVKALGMAATGGQSGQVQVSMNLIDWRRTPLHEALEMVRRAAKHHGVLVRRSEFVGFVPLGAILASARYYLQSPALDADAIVELALAREHWSRWTPWSGDGGAE